MLKYSVEYLSTNRLGPIVVWDNDLIRSVASPPAGSQLFTRLLSSQGRSNVYNLFLIFVDLIALSPQLVRVLSVLACRCWGPVYSPRRLWWDWSSNSSSLITLTSCSCCCVVPYMWLYSTSPSIGRMCLRTWHWRVWSWLSLNLSHIGQRVFCKYMFLKFSFMPRREWLLS